MDSNIENIVNRVSNSGIVLIDFEDYYPSDEILIFDITPFLFKGIIVKEKEFRQYLKEFDWSVYSNKYIVFHCTKDALLPPWSIMLLTIYGRNSSLGCFFGNKETYLEYLIIEKLKNIEYDLYLNKSVIIKGCGKYDIPLNCYVYITDKLMSVAKTIMFGEACSAVPVYKNKLFNKI